MLFPNSSYPGPPFWQTNGHLQTMAPGILRRVRDIAYSRERIQTPDGDFLDLDWIRKGRKQLVLLTHGLEGSSDRQYILGTAKLFAKNNWDVLAWNDPILTPECMPVEIARQHEFFHLEMPKSGGHCGFMTAKDEYSWAEQRALEFCSSDRI